LKKLFDVAVAIQAVRRRRDALFGRDLFGEPAWDILLDLYVAERSGRTLALSTVGALAGVPQTTAFRWMNQLLERGYIVRRADPHDARRGFIHLSPTGQTLLEALLMDMPPGSMRIENERPENERPENERHVMMSQQPS
jgi:DNA-binding MarR family transcriptional regulator